MKGQIRVHFYNSSGGHVESRVIEKGDVILLVSGGHILEILEAMDRLSTITENDGEVRLTGGAPE
jgi:hypothetical protein